MAASRNHQSTLPSTPTPAEKVYDVFISGAGPVGLFMAYQLERMGHTVYCCDTKSGPTDQSRSNTLSSRTMEVLALNGLAASFSKASVTMRGTASIYRGKTIGTFNTVDGKSTVFPYQTTISQSTVEEILIDMTKGLVHWRTQLVDYYTLTAGEEGDVVVCTVQPLDGTSAQTIKARFLVGADGSHSFVRKHYTGKDEERWNYDGYSIGTRFTLCDTKFGGKDAEKMFNNMDNLFMHENGFVNIIPLGSGTSREYLRMVMNDEYYYTTEERTTTHGVQPGAPPSIEEINAEMRKRVEPLDIFVTEPRWVTVYRINQRKANGFRRGPIFLVGDAGHCFSPLYGMGLNNGFQDAHNLAWKLSVVLKGYAPDPETLLNSFSAEREKIVKSTMDMLGQLTEVGMSKQNFLMAAIGRLSISFMTSIGWINKTFMMWVMQLFVRIGKDSSLVAKQSSSKLIASGLFMPDTTVLRRRVIADQIERKTLHEILAYGAPTSKYVVLWVSTRPSHHDPCPWTHAFWTGVAPWRHAVRPLVVESTWHAYEFDKRPAYALEATDDIDDDNAFWIEDSLIYPNTLTQRIGLEHYIKEKNPPAAFVVIRPDNYIAYSALIRSPSDIESALGRLSAYVK